MPPPLAELPAALDAFEKFLHSESDLPPLVRLAMAHYQFEAIHPFLDGNGRLGRMLLILLLSAWGILPQPLLYLSAHFEAHRLEYYDHLQAISTKGAWNDWLFFFFRAVESQSLDTIKRIKRFQELHERYHALFQRAQSSAATLKLIDFLFEQPILTVSQAKDCLDVTYPAASKHIRNLMDAGILEETGGRSRNRVYIAKEVLAAIEEPPE